MPRKRTISLEEKSTDSNKKKTLTTQKSDTQEKKKIFEFITPRSNEDGKKIVSWNVNGLRSVLKDEKYIKEYVSRENPDILCLSETKIDATLASKFVTLFPEFKYRYWSYAVKKGYSGTVVFSKIKPLSVERTLRVDSKKHDGEGRYLALEFEEFWLVHTYVPNSGMKLERLDYRTKEWDPAMLSTLKELETTKPIVWCGDLNVAHGDIDVHNPKGNRNKTPGFTDAERDNFSQVLANGFIDLYRKQNENVQQFTYWSTRFNCRGQNKGWRLDYFVISPTLEKIVGQCLVRSEIVGSDHCPIVLTINKNHS